MLSIRLDPAIEKRLDTLAKMTGRTKSYYVRELIEEYLEDIEDIYLAERSLKDARPNLTGTQIRKALGLDH